MIEYILTSSEKTPSIAKYSSQVHSNIIKLAGCNHVQCV